jgi:hypothetical protein
MTTRTIAFAPVRVEPQVLELFLNAMRQVIAVEPELELWLYDDNTDAASSAAIDAFVTELAGRCLVLPEIPLEATDYSRTGPTHTWSDTAVRRVTQIKNSAIRQFLETDASHLFLVDSDVLIPPGLIDHLRAVSTDVISAVYWTRFNAGQPFLPNVWDFNTYQFAGPDSILRLRGSGHHRVGGLGACTLVNRPVLEAGVGFSEIPNLRLWGEDRHFCVRAATAGFELMADSCVTPFHVYRRDLVPHAIEWLESGMDPDWFRTRWLTPHWQRTIQRMFSPSQEASA